jgi:hypothetical protein
VAVNTFQTKPLELQLDTIELRNAPRKLEQLRVEDLGYKLNKKRGNL